MPKIIENLQEKLLAEAKHQVLNEGYSSMTIRSVAKACGVGVGTVYNYYESKDMLVASFMLEDWLAYKERIETGCAGDATPESALHCVYGELCRFTEKYAGVFKDENAESVFASSFRQRHMMLRSQIARPLLRLCEQQSKVNPEFLAEFLAETLLTWSQSDCTFEEISGVLLQLF